MINHLQKTVRARMRVKMKKKQRENLCFRSVSHAVFVEGARQISNFIMRGVDIILHHEKLVEVVI